MGGDLLLMWVGARWRGEGIGSSTAVWDTASTLRARVWFRRRIDSTYCMVSLQHLEHLECRLQRLSADVCP